jgi:hypothetical protein
MPNPIRLLQLSDLPEDADLLADIDAYRASLSRRLRQPVTMEQAYRQLIALFILSDLPIEDQTERTTP